jgi:hypothetical protein
MRKSLARAVPLAGAFFAVSVSIEIVGVWDLSPGKGQNSGGERHSLITVKSSLIAHLIPCKAAKNSLFGRRRELARKCLIKLPFWPPLTRHRGPNR